MTIFSSKCWNRFFSKDKSILVPCRKQRRMRMLIAFYFTRYVVLEVSSFLLSCLGPLAQLIMFVMLFSCRTSWQGRRPMSAPGDSSSKRRLSISPPKAILHPISPITG